MVYLFKLLGVAILLLGCIAASGQIGGFEIEPDTIIETEYDPIEGDLPKARMFAGKPGKAALYSLILPGAGQIYNGKWWKAPIVWAGVGTVGYFTRENSRLYRCYRDAYRERLITDKEGLDPIDKYATGENAIARTDDLRVYRDRYNRLRQTTIMLFGLTWVLQSAEAFVDGHLTEFDISEDLTLQLRPMTIDDYTQSITTGVVLRF